MSPAAHSFARSGAHRDFTRRMAFNYSFRAYATAMKAIGAASAISVVDLGARAVAYLDARNDYGWASDNFFLVRADGTVDGTHFQEMGASVLSGLVAAGVRDLPISLAAYLR